MNVAKDETPPSRVGIAGIGKTLAVYKLPEKAEEFRTVATVWEQWGDGASAVVTPEHWERLRARFEADGLTLEYHGFDQGGK